MTICVTLLACAIGDHVVGDAAVAARNGDGLAAERFGEAQRVGDAIALLLVELQAAPAFDVKRDPGPCRRSASRLA